jgi:glycosyltransferase involved in cell wall biosynthesis
LQIENLQTEKAALDIQAIGAPDAISTDRPSEFPHWEVKPWRVTIFVSNLATDGGAEVQSIDLARKLKSRGWDISVLSLRRPKSGSELLASEGIPVHTVDAVGGNPVRPMWRLARYLREERPHILHCHMSHAVLAARLARLTQRIPVVIGTLHGLKMYNVRGTGWRLRETLHGLTDWLSDVTTVVCGAAADHYLSTGAVSRNSLRLIPNGVDTVRFQFDPAIRQRVRTELGVADQFVWLTVGRFQPVKDHHTLLRSFSRTLGQSPRSVLLLAGNGPMEGDLKELAHGLGIGSKVRFLGSRADIPALMNASDACVLSSIYEALPMVLLEAASAGVPAVATDVGGTSDIVIHGATGFLTPPTNTQALANAMLRLSSLPAASRASMGDRARRHATSRFGLDEVVGQWERLYQEMLVKNEARL